MAENYVYVIGQDGETYEICPTDGLLSFLQRLAEDEATEQQVTEEQIPEHNVHEGHCTYCTYCHNRSTF